MHEQVSHDYPERDSFLSLLCFVNDRRPFCRCSIQPSSQSICLIVTFMTDIQLIVNISYITDYYIITFMYLVRIYFINGFSLGRGYK